MNPSTSHVLPTPSVAAEKGVYAKVSWRIMPLLLICYMIAYLDRINIGYAQLQMKQTLPFSDAAYGIGAGIFFTFVVARPLLADLEASRAASR